MFSDTSTGLHSFSSKNSNSLHSFFSCCQPSPIFSAKILSLSQIRQFCLRHFLVYLLRTFQFLGFGKFGHTSSGFDHLLSCFFLQILILNPWIGIMGLFGLGELPKEYNRKIHGPYDPAVYYGKSKFLSTKLHNFCCITRETVSSLKRRNVDAFLKFQFLICQF